MDDLSGFLDLIKSHIVLNNDKVNAKAIQKRIMDNRILIRKTIELLSTGSDTFCQKISRGGIF